jgi:hypothetical protein
LGQEAELIEDYGDGLFYEPTRLPRQRGNRFRSRSGTFEVKRNDEEEREVMTFKNLLKTSLLASLLGAAALTATGCEEQGPFEEAGEEVDDTIDEAGDTFD